MRMNERFKSSWAQGLCVSDGVMYRRMLQTTTVFSHHAHVCVCVCGRSLAAAPPSAHRYHRRRPTRPTGFRSLHPRTDFPSCSNGIPHPILSVQTPPRYYILSYILLLLLFVLRALLWRCNDVVRISPSPKIGAIFDACRQRWPRLWLQGINILYLILYRVVKYHNGQWNISTFLSTKLTPISFYFLRKATLSIIILLQQQTNIVIFYYVKYVPSVDAKILQTKKYVINFRYIHNIPIIIIYYSAMHSILKLYIIYYYYNVIICQ